MKQTARPGLCDTTQDSAQLHTSTQLPGVNRPLHWHTATESTLRLHEGYMSQGPTEETTAGKRHLALYAVRKKITRLHRKIAALAPTSISPSRQAEGIQNIDNSNTSDRDYASSP